MDTMENQVNPTNRAPELTGPLLVLAEAAGLTDIFAAAFSKVRAGKIDLH